MIPDPVQHRVWQLLATGLTGDDEAARLLVDTLDEQDTRETLIRFATSTADTLAEVVDPLDLLRLIRTRLAAEANQEGDTP